MKTISKLQISLPTWALGYIFNSDATGLTKEEEKQIGDFVQPYYDEAKKVSGHMVISPANEEMSQYFTKYPAFGLPCDCINCNVLILA